MSTEHYTRSQIERTVKRIVKPLVTGLFVIFIVGPVLGLFIQLLWNATVAVMFDLTPISFWQAVGLFILAKFFFGFGSHSDQGQKKARLRVSSDAASGDAEPDGDESFRAWWDEEGKNAYGAFQARQSEDEGE